ncbi:MAG: sigma 54-interacting transcriptional regulator [Syntrophales bacterium]|nr:sigma 54-interacting transcriptional regulator [Syntrophales bacterium]MDD5232050.1 sigma 54-interacting transcriptional regulator [Syntrophales bacterium]MDD5532521.1 sigma 54-interacting transcriptional regulator [Syntrophales bacterium]HPL63501.1 sigma 54-interacting transcriptional regulator [Syntrophales bacterium]
MPDTKRIKDLELLYEISTSLNQSFDLKKTLYSVLDILANSIGMIRGTIFILNPLRDEISIEVAHGLSQGAIERGKYKIGEGITGTVIQTGKSVIVPKISQEPMFLNRTASRKSHSSQELSFICVPIKKGSLVVGALSVDRLYDDSFSLTEGENLLSVIATMIAQHVINLENFYLEQEQLRKENQRLRGELGKKFRINNIIGNSSKMAVVFQMISQVSQSNATVLIRGESGTGKELVANAIHYASQRARNPFVKVNCAAMPSNLIESELFGHEKGSFTGAIRQKIGKFELANNGTIFLDEVGSIGVEVQVKLLRVLQEKEFERVGGSHTIKTDVRILAATNKNLEEAIEKGVFREDLYYRLNVFPIYLPPLRERMTDILMLADSFLEKYAKENHRNVRSFSKAAIDMLMMYDWPGNVRELENCIERAVLLCGDEDMIQAYHLPPTLQRVKMSSLSPGATLEDTVQHLEREKMIDALRTTRGNMAKAAQILGVTERKFTYRAKKYGIDFHRFRAEG